MKARRDRLTSPVIRLPAIPPITRVGKIYYINIKLKTWVDKKMNTYIKGIIVPEYVLDLSGEIADGTAHNANSHSSS
jgi:hypothetical protein